MSSKFIPKSKIQDIAQVGLSFSINGQTKQSGTAKDMIFDVPHLIEFVSGIMRLEVSDRQAQPTAGRISPTARG